MIFGREPSFDDRSILGRIFEPFQRLLRWFASFGGAGDERRGGLDGEPIWKSVILFPWRILGGFLQFLFHNWSSSRSSNAFSRALPVLGTLAGLVAVFAVAIYWLELTRVDFYRDRVLYYRQNDLPFSEACARKLVSLKPTDSHKYLLGLSLAQNKDFYSALALMRSITPIRLTAETGPDSATATEPAAEAGQPETQTLRSDKVPEAGEVAPHVWLATAALGDKRWELSEDERKSLAVRHLREAIAIDGENNSFEGNFAIVNLAKLLLQEESYEEAYILLNKALQAEMRHPIQLQSLQLLLATLKAQDKEREVAARVEQITPKLELIAGNFPDFAEPWLALIELSFMAKQYDAEVRFVEEALRTTTQKSVRDAVGTLYTQHLLKRASEIQAPATREEFLFKYSLILQALVNGHQNQFVYPFLDEYVDLEPQVPNEDEYLRWALGTAPHPWATHLILGIRDCFRAEPKSAKTHWRIAANEKVGAPIILGKYLQVAAAQKAFSADQKAFSADQIQSVLGPALEEFPNTPALIVAQADCFAELQKDYEKAIALYAQLLEADGNDDLRERYADLLASAGRNAEAEVQRELLKSRANSATTKQ